MPGASWSSARSPNARGAPSTVKDAPSGSPSRTTRRLPGAGSGVDGAGGAGVAEGGEPGDGVGVGVGVAGVAAAGGPGSAA